MGDSVCRKCGGGDWKKCEHWAVDAERNRPAPADPEVMLCARWKAKLGLCHACSLRKTRNCLPDPDGCADYMPERVRCDICSHGGGGACGLSRTPPEPGGAGCPDFEKTAGLGFKAGKDKAGGVFICNRCAKQSTHKCLPGCWGVCRDSVEKGG